MSWPWTTAAAAVAFTIAISFVPFINPTGSTLEGILDALLTAAMPTILGGAAVMYLLIDLLLGAIRQRKAWLYALLSALPAMLVTAVIAALGDGSMKYVLAFSVVLPGLLGGWVLGRSREQLA